MYTLGETPLILQGAGQREILTPEQMQRVNTMIVERGGTPVTPTYSAPPPKPPGTFLASMAGLTGDIPLWVVAVGGIGLAALITRRGGRNVW